MAEFKGRYAGEMQDLPLTVSITDMPHVFLKSTDGHWRVNIAPSRIDSMRSIDEHMSEIKLQESVKEIIEPIQSYIKDQNLMVGRLALVVHRNCKVSDPAKLLVERFCKESCQTGPFKGTASFEIHNHKVYKPNFRNIDYRINSWARCKAGRKNGW